MTSAAETIRQARHRRGWSQAELAAAVGVSRSAVAQWETGRAGQLTMHLLSIARALDVPPASLLEGVEIDGLGAAAEARIGVGDELALLRLYRLCQPNDQQLLLRTAHRLAHTGEAPGDVPMASHDPVIQR